MRSASRNRTLPAWTCRPRRCKASSRGTPAAPASLAQPGHSVLPENRSERTSSGRAPASFQTASFQTASFQTASFQTASFQTASFQTASFQTTSFQTTSFSVYCPSPSVPTPIRWRILLPRWDSFPPGAVGAGCFPLCNLAQTPPRPPGEGRGEGVADIPLTVRGKLLEKNVRGCSTSWQIPHPCPSPGGRGEKGVTNGGEYCARNKNAPALHPGFQDLFVFLCLWNDFALNLPLYH
jgi:hypothetical protein